MAKCFRTSPWASIRAIASAVRRDFCARRFDICAHAAHRCLRSRGIEWMIVGRGTNLLVSDEGYDGVIITLGRDFRSHVVDAEAGLIIAGAGATLSSVVQDAFRSSLAGLEFAVGTPGSIGGAIRMNAGSRDEWIGSLVRDVTTYSPSRGLTKRLASDIDWQYRCTDFDANETILECALNVEIVDPFSFAVRWRPTLQSARGLSRSICLAAEASSRILKARRPQR